MTMPISSTDATPANTKVSASTTTATITGRAIPTPASFGVTPRRRFSVLRRPAGEQGESVGDDVENGGELFDAALG